jgi:hypothetical protein
MKQNHFNQIRFPAENKRFASNTVDGKFFYVTDGNIMYLTDASRSLISCVIQHYAPVVGCGGEEQMHNVDYDPGP